MYNIREYFYMGKALIVGGSSGIGLSLALELLDLTDEVYILDRNEPKYTDLPKDKAGFFKTKAHFIRTDISSKDISIFNSLVNDVDTLIITAGFGRVAKLEQLTSVEVNKLMQVNMVAPIRILKMFYSRIQSKSDFYTAVIGSISGHITSPLFSVYGASKSGLCSFVRNINVELIHEGYKNRILDVSPGSFKGSSFTGSRNNLILLSAFSKEILKQMYSRKTLYIPEYDAIYKNVINRNKTDPIAFGLDSYDYKIKNNKLSTKPQVIVGYLSGTFDLFHIGHLNLLKRAKEQCDYLIVGVHESGAWKGKETFIPFDERLDIVKSIEFVDEADKSLNEDSDAWKKYHFNKLFVGSDYKGTERFKRYEEFFKDKDVDIIYFPYTKGTSSTQLRDRLAKK